MSPMDRLQLQRVQQQAEEDGALGPAETLIDAVPGYYSRFAVDRTKDELIQVSAALGYTEQRLVFSGLEQNVSCDFAIIDKLELQQEDTFVTAEWESEAGPVEVDWRSERGQKITEFFEAMMAVCNARRAAAPDEDTAAETAEPADEYEITDIICLSALEADTMEFEQFAVAFKVAADSYQLTGKPQLLSWAEVWAHGVHAAADKGGELMLTVMDPRGGDW